MPFSASRIEIWPKLKNDDRKDGYFWIDCWILRFEPKHDMIDEKRGKTCEMAEITCKRSIKRSGSLPAFGGLRLLNRSCTAVLGYYKVCMWSYSTLL